MQKKNTSFEYRTKIGAKHSPCERDASKVRNVVYAKARTHYALVIDPTGTTVGGRATAECRLHVHRTETSLKTIITFAFY